MTITSPGANGDSEALGIPAATMPAFVTLTINLRDTDLSTSRPVASANPGKRRPQGRPFFGAVGPPRGDATQRGGFRLTCDPQALGNEAMHALLRRVHLADPAIHRHAGKRIGI